MTACATSPTATRTPTTTKAQSMTHTKARRHEVKNGKRRSSETFVPSCLRVRPPSIAQCLARLDDLISAETQKLEALQTHKHGLMQQLFQSPEVEA